MKEAAVLTWRAQADHLAAQAAGKARWYRAYRIRVCRVEREYGFERQVGPAPRGAGSSRQ